MQDLLRGLRSGLALFKTNPAASVASVVALALGIGFSTTMFSIVRGGTRNLPFEDSASIVAVQWLRARPGAPASSTLADLERWTAGSRTMSALGAFRSEARNIGNEGGVPERVQVSALTASTFALLGVRPVLGRLLTEADGRPGAAPVAVLSDTLWASRFNRDPGVLGQSVRLDGRAHEVVGVMGPGFGFPVNADLWTSLPEADPSAGGGFVQVFGRLAAGSSRDEAASELETIARAAAPTEDIRAAMALDVVNFIDLETPRETRWGLYILLAAVTGVLVIACVNVANLFIVRAVARGRDVAIRLALGAERRALLVEQVAESLVLSLLSSAAGVGIAWAGTRAFRLATADILNAFWMNFRVDTTVLLYALTLAVCAAAAAAVFPAIQASRTDVVSTLRDGGRGSSSLRIGRLSRGLVSGQIALASGLLAFTLLIGQAAVALQLRAWPFDPDAVLSAQIGVPFATLDDEAARGRLLRALQDGLNAMPGARAAALASVVPGRGAGNNTFSFDGPGADPRRSPATGLTMVSPAYFDVLGARALRGRVIADEDVPGAPTAVVANESFVARFTADRDPVGRRIFIGSREATIVGVVPDLMSGDVDSIEQDGLYASIHQVRPYAVRVLATGPAGSPSLVRPLRAVVDAVDRDLPVFETYSVREAAMGDKQVLGVLGRLFGLFGAGALLLTAIGLYSVTAFSVIERQREFGVRAALGATRADLLRLVAGEGGRQLAVGLPVGVLLAFLMTRGFAAAVEFTSGNDPLVLGGVVVSLLLTSAVAMIGPARRASRVDPAEVLRR